MINEFQQLIDAYRQTDFTRRRAALATVVGLRGSGYRRPGARMYITDDGKWTGAISGGCLEGDALRKAREVMSSGQSRVVVYDTSDPEGENFGIGLGCNGVLDVLLEPVDPHDPGNRLETLARIIRDRCVTTLETPLPDGSVFAETLRPDIQLLVFGAGYDAVPLVQLARQVGWRVVITDDCVAHLMPKRFAAADEMVAIPRDEVAEKLPIDEFSAAVLLSHNYTYDRAVLEQLLQTAIPYIGLLGPKKRGDALLGEVAGLKPGDTDRVFWPVGLDLGAETPQEIALSVVAEIQAFFRRGSARSLKVKKAPIHQPDDALPGGPAA